MAAGTAVSGFYVCFYVCVFASTFHRPQETNAEELGACERHCSDVHTWRMEHLLLEISVKGCGSHLSFSAHPFGLFSHINVVGITDFFPPVHGGFIAGEQQ